MKNNNQKQIAGAIIIAGILIAGAVLLKGNSAFITKNETNNSNGIPVTTTTLARIGKEDRILGNPNAKVAIVMYEDFQCPFCGAISGLDPKSPLIQSLKQRDPMWTPLLPGIIADYVNNFELRNSQFL